MPCPPRTIDRHGPAAAGGEPDRATATGSSRVSPTARVTAGSAGHEAPAATTAASTAVGPAMPSPARAERARRLIAYQTMAPATATIANATASTGRTVALAYTPAPLGRPAQTASSQP